MPPSKRPIRRNSGADMDERRENDVSTRLARVEENYVSIRREVHDLGEAIRIQGEALSSEIRSLTDRVAARSEPQWGVYFSGLGVLLAFVIAVGSGALAPLYLMASTNSNQLTEATTQLQERIDSKIDSVNAIRKSALDSMDEVLQREMRLIKEAQDTHVSHTQTQINLIRNRLSIIDDRLRSHEMLDGHPTAMQMHAEGLRNSERTAQRLENAVKALDTKLQTEMNLANGRLEDRLRVAEELFHREIDQIRNAVTK